MNLKSYIKRWVKIIRGATDQVQGSNQNPHQKTSYSQCGEDLIVQYIFQLRGITHPSYIDIGANDPYFLNNTAVFYEKGCRGINIEANPLLYQKFTIARPNDINLNIGVGSKEDELDFFVMTDDTLSSFSKEECDAMVSYGKTLKTIIKIKLDTVSHILEEYFNNQFPDFMTIDVEGMDFQILQSIDFDKYWPKIICVEAAEYSPIGAGERREELINYLVGKGYYEYANTNLNAIMVKKEFWFI
jgi:FkbM family methyltransferase